MVAKYFVYGEDGLTLIFLMENLEDILVKLDRSKPEDCIIYYRPSFGRGRYYGEFDAILITPSNAYLIESKWDGSSDLASGLRKNQTIRHKILRWYQKNWKGGTDEEWNVFSTSTKMNSRINLRENTFPRRILAIQKQN